MQRPLLLPRLAKQRSLPALAGEDGARETVDAARKKAADAARKSAMSEPARESITPPVRSPSAPRKVRRPGLAVALFSGTLLLSGVPLLRYVLTQEPADEATRAPVVPQLAEDAPPLREPTQRNDEHAPPASEGAQPAGGVRGSSADAPQANEEAQASEEEARARLVSSLIMAGNHALSLGALEEAERQFMRVLELSEDQPRATYGLARVRLVQGDLVGAEDFIQRALRRRPRRGAYHAVYADILRRLGRDDEAATESEVAQGSAISGED